MHQRKGQLEGEVAQLRTEKEGLEGRAAASVAEAMLDARQMVAHRRLVEAADARAAEAEAALKVRNCTLPTSQPRLLWRELRYVNNEINVFVCISFMQLERDRGAELERRAATALASHEQEVQAAVEATAAAEAKAAEAISAARTAVEGRQLAEAWAGELQVVFRQAQQELAQRAEGLVKRTEALCVWEQALR